jgi:hypothetical protein
MIKHITIDHVEQIWQSPDKKRTLWLVTYTDGEGRREEARTYSGNIAGAQLGSTIDVFWEMRPKKNKPDESEPYIKLPPKDDHGGGSSRGDSGASQDAKDQSIRAQVALKAAVQLAINERIETTSITTAADKYFAWLEMRSHGKVESKPAPEPQVQPYQPETMAAKPPEEDSLPF